MRRFLALGAALGLALASVGGVAAAGSHAPREVMMPPRGAAGHAKPVRSSNLSFRGGNPGVVKGTDRVYLVFWGTGWSSDPSGEAGVLTDFFNAVGGSSWNNSVTQYCDGVQPGTTDCTRGSHATNPSGVLAGTWSDTTNAAPLHPSQADLAGEAVRAAAYFTNNATANLTAQYVIATATGHSASGFGSSYCAWHSSTSTQNSGRLAYTNLPYITDAGWACGANFNGLGGNAGITIVEGHEFAETETDIFPNGGWLDSSGAENGDKCAWISSGQGASENVAMYVNGPSFPVQSLWSNDFNGGRGGCVVSYP